MIVDLYLLLSAVISAFASVAVAGELGLSALLIFVGMTVGLFIGFIVLHLVLCFVAGMFTDLSEPCTRRRPIYRAVAAISAAGVLRIMRVRVHISGKELPRGRFLLVSNHLSAFDPIVCIDKLRACEIAFISKPENFKIPIAGKFIHNCNYLPIDRDNARNAMRTINAAADLMKNDICSVGVYPEGTRSRTGELQEFHDGVFRSAAKAKVPIAVVTVRGTENISRNFPLKATDVYLHIAEVIEHSEYCGLNYHELGKAVRDIMLDSLAQMQ